MVNNSHFVQILGKKFAEFALYCEIELNIS